MKKKIVINKNKCISCGACISLSPNQAIKFDDDFKAEVIPEKLTEEDNIVVDVCPTEAISLEDENKE